MTQFEYILVFVSILVGLAIADLTLSLHRLIRAGRRVKWHWMSPAAAMLSATAVLSQYWVLWTAKRSFLAVPLWGFLPLAAVLVLTFLATAAALPDEVPHEGVLDLKAYYFAARRQFWTLAALWLASLVSYRALTQTGAFAAGFHARAQALNGVVLAVIVSLATVRRAWWHTLWLIVLLALAAWSWTPLRLT